MRYLVYEVKNLINQKIYIGVHKTSDIHDGYMGSGILLKKAQKKYGIENFSRRILFEATSSEEMYKKEAELVTPEFIKRKDTYNLTPGGNGGFQHLSGTFKAINKNGHVISIKDDDPRYQSGEYESLSKGKQIAEVSPGIWKMVDSNDPRWKTGELVNHMAGKRVCRNKSGEVVVVDSSEASDFVGVSTGMNCGYDSKGNKHYVSVSDPRWKTGELKTHWSGKQHKKETLEKMSKAQKERLKDPTKNSQYGTIWIHSLEEKKSKKWPGDKEIPKGWKKGRKMKFD